MLEDVLLFVDVAVDIFQHPTPFCDGCYYVMQIAVLLVPNEGRNDYR
jgi:hypothetical protein